MKYTKTISFILTAIVFTILLAVQVLIGESHDARASVIVGNDYNSYEASSSIAAANTPRIVKQGVGSLGSVIVIATSSGPLYIYDNALATSTGSSTRIAVFPQNTQPGTYTFDRDIKLGIVVEAPTGYTGEYVVTHR